MPMQSQAQSRFMHWADENPGAAAKAGLKRGVAEKFIAASHGERVRDLPERVAHKAQGGAVEPVGYPPRFRW